MDSIQGCVPPIPLKIEKQKCLHFPPLSPPPPEHRNVKIGMITSPPWKFLETPACISISFQHTDDVTHYSVAAPGVELEPASGWMLMISSRVLQSRACISC